MSEQREQKAFHWLVVGYVSPAARAMIEEKGGQLRELSSEPPLVPVALAYDRAGAWSWSHGEEQHRIGVEFWSSGYLEEASTGLMLQYGAVTGGSPEYASVTETYLVLPDEDALALARQMGERESSAGVSVLSGPVPAFDEHEDPFVPDFPDEQRS